MTSIKELQQLHKEEMSNFKATTFTHKKALEELKSADKATSLGQCFNSILKVVNRYPNTKDKEIKQGLLKHEQVLRLIKKINRPDTDWLNGVASKSDTTLQEVYELTIKQFNNQLN
jgi:hypothetical protein